MRIVPRFLSTRALTRSLARSLDAAAARGSTSPPAMTRRALSIVSAVRPYARARGPQALLPIMPPIVHLLEVEGSGP